MIKEKHEKGPEGPKEEPTASDKDSASADVRVKKEDDIKKEPTSNPVTKNGGIVGSTNTGSVQGTPDRKEDDTSSTTVPSDTASLTMKQEDSVDGDSLAEAAFGLGGPGPGGGTPTETQPLPTNTKPPTSAATAMEVHYMQQQSQIFVFSTMLANSGAEEVQLGRYPSIIAYHCAQPGTKKYLEKNPLKHTQFNRQHPAQWLNSLAMMKSGAKGCARSPGLGSNKGGPPPAPCLDNFLTADALDDMVGLTDSADAPWESKPHLDGLENAVANGLPPDIDGGALGNMQPKLQGVQVPDENLTPQQRQHREEKLVTMRKLQQMLFPESQGGENPQDPNQPPQQQGQGPPCNWQGQQQRPVGPTGQNVPVGPGSCGGNTGNSGQRGSQGTSGQRLQGPPPPYHQTPRSASVPIALQSPSPASPNNPTSNLSLPSPRASSALNSPADPNRPPFGGLTRHMSTGHSPTSQDSPSAQRLNHSNPGTPLSAHLSPSVSNLETSSTVALPQTSDPIFGRNMSQRPPTSNASCSGGPPTSLPSGGPGPSQPPQGQPQGPQQGREPNLMPVPSPQQIQYLNTFEGQELIIQKQPNTGLKDGNMISPPVMPGSNMENAGFPGAGPEMGPRGVSGPNTPTSVGGPQFPPTPSVSNDGCRFSIPSPHTPNASSGAEGKLGRMPMGTASSAMSPTGAPQDLKSDLFPTPSPHMMDMPRFPGPPQGPNASPGTKMPSGFNMNVSPQGKPSPLELPGYCRGDNIPLNPNCTSSISGNPKSSHFDPISSLAQMSQQLTNSVASSLNGQGAPMMNFGSPSTHMMEMPGCHGGMGELDNPNMMGMGPMQGPPHGFHPGSPMGPLRSLSPKLGGPSPFPNHMPMPRMVGRLPGPPGPNPYNGANVQVKPNAPNTIQYLPAKPTGGAPVGGPRGPPSLDFLARLAGPMSGMMEKPTGPGMPSPGQGYFQGPPHMGHMDDGPGNPMMMGNGMPMGGPVLVRGGPPQRPVMRGLPPQMGGPFGGEPVFGGGPHPQMFVGGPKGSPMALGGPPDASQPLPPSMGQAGPGPAPFKGGCTPFVGPATADPNYAQQYHNFQQQLYATNTRAQMGGPQAMGPGPGPPPHMQQPPYFNPK